MANRELMITLGLDTSSYSQNVKRAKDLNKELDSSFKLLSSSSEKFEDSIKGLGKKQDYLEEKIKVATGLTQVYSDRLKESEKALSDATKKSIKHKSEIDSLNKSLEEGSIDQKTYEERLKSATQQFDKAEKAINTHNKRILEAKVGYNQTQIAMQELTRESVLVSEKLNNLKADEGIKALKDNIKGLKDNLSSSKEAVDGFSNTITGLKKTQETYSQSLKDSKSLLNSYGEEIKKSTQSINKYQKELDATTKELKEWEEILDSIDINDGDFKEASKLFDEARVEVEKLRAEYTQINTAMDYHNKRLKEMQSGYKTTEKNIATFDRELGQVDKSMKKLNQQKIFDNLDNQIKSVTDYIGVLESKLEMANSTMKNFGKTKEGLTTKTEIYKEKVLQLKKQLELLNTTLDKNGKELNELKAEQDIVAQSINRVRMEMLKMDKDSPDYEKKIIALARLEKSYDELGNEIKDFQAKNHRLQSEINTTTAHINNLARETNSLRKNFNADWFNGVGNSLSKAGQVLSGAGQSMLGLSVVVGGAQTAIITTGMEFQAQMSKVGALTGETGAELEKTMETLETGARALAKSTKFSATEVAQGLEDLVLAGYDAEKALETLPLAMQFAQAGSIELSTATEDLIMALSSLGENAELNGTDLDKMTILAEQLALVANATTTDLDGLAKSVLKVGGQVENMKIPLSTATTMLGILGDKGILAEEAGNSLNSILINLTQSTGQSADAMEALGLSAFDAEGNIKPIEQTLGELKKKLDSFDGDKQEIILTNMLGGKTQAKTLQKLLQGIDADTGEFTEKYKNLKKELEGTIDLTQLENGTTALEEMSKAMNDNLKGDLKILTSQIEESFLVVFDAIEPQLRETVQKITKTIGELTQKFTEWFSTLDDEGKQKFVDFVLGLSAFLVIAPPVLMVIGGMASGLGAIFKALGWVVGKFPTFTKEVEGAGGQVTDLNKKMQKVVDDIPKMVNSVKNYGSIVGSFFAGMATKVGGWIAGLGTTITGSALWSSLSGLLTTIGGWISTAFGAIFSVAGAKFIAIAVAIVGAIYLIYKAIKYLWENWDKIVESMKEAWTNSMEWIGEKADWIKEKMGLFVEGIKKGFEALVQFFKELPSKIMEFLKKIPKMINVFLNTVTTTFLKALAMLLANIIGFAITMGKQIYDTFAGIFKSLGGVFDVLVGIFTLNFEKIKEGVKNIFGGIWDIIANTFKNGWAFISGAFENIMSIFNFDASGITQSIENFFIEIWTKFTTWLSTLWTDVSTWFSNLMAQIPVWLAGIGLAIGAWFVQMWTNFTTWATNLWTSFTTWLTEMKNSLLTWLSETWTSFTTWLTNLWNSFAEWCTNMKNKLVGWLTEFAKDPIGYMKQFANNIANGLKEAWNNFINWCSDMLNKLQTWFSQLISDTWVKIQEWANKFGEGVQMVLKFFKDLPSNLYNIGVEMISNLWEGFKSRLSQFGNWVKEGVGNIVGGLFRSANPSIDAEVNYDESNIPTTIDNFSNIPTMNVGYARDSFANMGDLIGDMFKQAFSLDNYKTTGGFYTPNSVRVSNTASNDNSSLLQALLQQNQLLMQILTNSTIEVGVNVDGRQIARASARYMETEINTLNKRKNRIGGLAY